MTIFDNILNVILPHEPTHSVFESANRLKSQHFLGFVLALCTIGFYAHMGQASIGYINQVQVSNHSLVPNYPVIAQPQMLFLVLDKHLNRPTFQIVGYNTSHRSTQIISDNRDMFTLSLTAREDNLDCVQLIQSTNTLSSLYFLVLHKPAMLYHLPLFRKTFLPYLPSLRLSEPTLNHRLDLPTPI